MALKEESCTHTMLCMWGEGAAEWSGGGGGRRGNWSKQRSLN